MKIKFFECWNIFWWATCSGEIHEQKSTSWTLDLVPRKSLRFWPYFFSLFLSISLFVFGLDSKNVSESKKMKAISSKMPICVWLLIKTIINLKWFCSYIGCEFVSSCTPGGMMNTGCILEASLFIDPLKYAHCSCC